MAKVKDPDVDKQIHAGRREKLRRLFCEHGLDTFNETQVLEYALGLTQPRVDTNPTAHRLMNTFGSLIGVIEAHPEKLQQIDGVGPSAAVFLSFLRQFLTYAAHLQKPTVQIKSPGDALGFLEGVMKTLSVEHFFLVALDKNGRVILQDIFQGNLDKVDIDTREIVDAVLRRKASSVIFAHNHLGASPSPSDADVRMTRRLVNVLLPLDIGVMDHIIFGEGGETYSFAAQNLLDVFKREHAAFAGSRDYEDYI